MPIRKADLIMQYVPKIQKGDIADIYVAGMKLFSVRLGEIDCSFETAEIRNEVRPGVVEVTIPADFVPNCKITIEGTVQSDVELSFTKSVSPERAATADDMISELQQFIIEK